MRRMNLLLPMTAIAILLAVSCARPAPESAPKSAAGVALAAERSAPPPASTATSTPPATPAPPATAAAGTPFSTDRVELKPNPDPPVGTVLLRDVRIGVHPDEGVERIVFEFSGGIPEGSVEYVNEVFQCGSGFPVTLPGRAILLARFTGADAHDERGQPTAPAQRLQGPGVTILEAQQVCDFEAHVDWAMGLGAKQPFRVVQLTSPFRVVVDVQREAAAPPTPVAPTATPATSALLEAFKPFARQLENALKARDASFLVNRALLSSTTCPNVFEPLCQGRPAGAVVEGVPIGRWRSEGQLLPITQFRDDVNQYLNSLTRPTLFAIASWERPGGLTGGPGVLAIVTDAVDLSASVRVFAFVQDGADWKLRLMLLVPVLQEEWLSGECGECYDQWQRLAPGK